MTARGRTEVVEILPLIKHVPISDAHAKELGRAARDLGWAGVFHIPHSSPPVFVVDAATNSLSAETYVHLDGPTTAALGSSDIILDAVEHCSDAQLAELKSL